MRLSRFGIRAASPKSFSVCFYGLRNEIRRLLTHTQTHRERDMVLRSVRFERRDQSPALTKGILRNNRHDPLRSWQDPILRKAADVSLGVLCFLLNRCCSRRGMEWRIYLEPHRAKSTESRDPGAAPAKWMACTLGKDAACRVIASGRKSAPAASKAALMASNLRLGGLNCKQSVKPPVPGPRLES